MFRPWHESKCGRCGHCMYWYSVYHGVGPTLVHKHKCSTIVACNVMVYIAFIIYWLSDPCVHTGGRCNAYVYCFILPWLKFRPACCPCHLNTWCGDAPFLIASRSVKWSLHGRHMRLRHLMSNVRYRFTLGSESRFATFSWLSPPGCLGLHVWAATVPAGELKSHIPGHSQPSLAQRILPVWVLLFKLCKLFTSIRYIISMWFLPIGFAWGCEAQGCLRLWLAEIVADRGHQRQWHTKTKVEKQQHTHKVKHTKKAEGTKLLKLGRGPKKTCGVPPKADGGQRGVRGPRLASWVWFVKPTHFTCQHPEVQTQTNQM
jgi:hypothetical protein